jgi:hypothetical protein
MIHCDKLLALGLAKRKEVLEKSGLCMFCLKHSAEFQCYGRGGLSKPRCTHSGCDGEHTPNLHTLMSESDVKVSLVAGSGDEEGPEAGDECGDEYEYEWEYENGGLWVGTVSTAEAPEWGGETPISAGARARAPSEGQREEEEAGESSEKGSDFQEHEGAEEGLGRDGWWDLRPDSPDPEDAWVSILQAGPPHWPPRGSPRPEHSTTAERQQVRRRWETAADQQWEETRQQARLKQMTGSDSSSEDDDEGQLGGWGAESFEPP